MSHNPLLLPKLRSEALRQACGQMPCCLRIASMVPGLGCSHEDTVVGAHIASIGRGVNTKGTDLMMVAACMTCHDLLDRRHASWHWLHQNYPGPLMRRVIDGLAETQACWLQMGLLTIPDGEVI